MSFVDHLDHHHDPDQFMSIAMRMNENIEVNVMTAPMIDKPSTASTTLVVCVFNSLR